MSGAADFGADVIVVGAGSAGCVVAEHLSRDPARRVLLLEGGPAWPGDDDLLLGRLPISDGDRVRHHRTTSGADLPRGVGLGGSSAVNGGYFLRGHRADYDRWPTGWAATDVEPYFDRIDGGPAGGGVMSVEAYCDSELHPIAAKFEQAWPKAPVSPNREAWPDVGINRVRSNRSGKFRVSTAHSYLKQSMDRPNLEVVTRARVDVLTTRGRVVTGVEVSGRQIRADTVVLCAGTFGTALILLRSDVPTENRLLFADHREAMVGYRYRGPGAPRSGMLQTVAHTVDGLEIRPYSGDFADYIPGMPRYGPVVGVGLMHPEHRGTLSLDDSGDLVIEPAPLSPHDVERLEDGVRVVTGVLVNGLADLVSDVQVRPHLGTSQHACGSLPLGSFADDQGAVDGVRGLHVIDGSVIPYVGSSGPHATVVMVAERMTRALLSRST